MRCPNCGHSNPEEAAYCRKCWRAFGGVAGAGERTPAVERDLPAFTGRARDQVRQATTGERAPAKTADERGAEAHAPSRGVARAAGKRAAGRWLALIGLLASLAIAAYGQHIIDDQGTLGSGWPLLGRFDTKLTTIYQGAQSVAFSIPLLIIGAAIFALSVRYLLGARRAEPGAEPGAVASEAASTGRWWPLAPAALGTIAAGAWSYVVIRLALDHYDSTLWWLFWISLAVGGGALFAVDRRLGARLTTTLRWHAWEFALVALLTAFFIGLMVPTLDNWYYARIGDEGVFWDAARAIADGTYDHNYFSERGPYGYIPVMSSLYQATVMRLAGVDNFGWRFASMLAIAASLPAFYWLLRTLAGVRPAVFGTAILTFSHYLFAYAHTGYPNILSLFPTITAFALFFAGLRSRSTLLLFGSGAVAGLGFYTFYSSRFAIVILAVAVAIMAIGELRAGTWRRWLWQVPGPIAVGFIMTATPIFATDGTQVISDMRQQSLFQEHPLDEALTEVLYNLPRALMGFNFQLGVKHYVSGSLLDEVSAVLAVLGLGYAVTRVRDEGIRFLLIWAVISATIAGVLHARAVDHLPTRMHYALPPMAAFAGLALDRIVAGVSRLFESRRLELALGIACFAIVLPAILGFNIHRFYVATPATYHNSSVAVVYREASRSQCDVKGKRVAVLALNQSVDSVRQVFDYYRWEDHMPSITAYDAEPGAVDVALAEEDLSCVLLSEPEVEEAEAPLAQVQQFARERGATPVDVTDDSGKTHVVVVQLGTSAAASEAR